MEKMVLWGKSLKSKWKKDRVKIMVQFPHLTHSVWIRDFPSISEQERAPGPHTAAEKATG
jgi:hypothetical protein